MTVGELKEKLAEYPEDFEICLVDCETACLYHAKDIKKFNVDNIYPFMTWQTKIHKTLYIE